MEGWPASAKTHAFQFVVLLPFHPSILEPDFNLPLGEAKRVRDLNPPPARQIAVEVKLLLQLECLVAGVRRPCTFPVGARHICGF